MATPQRKKNHPNSNHKRSSTKTVSAEQNVKYINKTNNTMKAIKFLIVAAMAALATLAAAQDFSDPKYAKWGETPEQRKENILASTFLKEELANRNFNVAAQYLQQLLQRCPGASENTYANGIKLYKQKINRARSLAEKNQYVDSLLLLYDIRVEYFGSHPKRGKAYILDRKAREHLTYRESDREGIRQSFEVAIAAQVEANGTADPELVAIYFKNLCDDYTNDIVDAMTIVNAYDANFSQSPQIFSNTLGSYPCETPPLRNFGYI